MNNPLALLINNIPAIVALVLPVIAALAGSLYHSQVAKLPANVQPFVSQIVTSSVRAVEQSMQGIDGPQKKAEAVSMVMGLLKSYNITVPVDLVSTLIEEAVYSMNEFAQAFADQPDPNPPTTPAASSPAQADAQPTLQIPIIPTDGQAPQNATPASAS